MPQPELVGPAGLVLGQSVSSFMQLLPRLSEVGRGSPSDPELAADVRMGEFAAAVVAIGTGVIMASLTGSPVPAFAAAVMVGALLFVYESALRSGGSNA